MADLRPVAATAFSVFLVRAAMLGFHWRRAQRFRSKEEMTTCLAVREAGGSGWQRACVEFQGMCRCVTRTGGMRMQIGESVSVLVQHVADTLVN